MQGRLDNSIVIAIGQLQLAAKAGRNALDHAHAKVFLGSYHNSADMSAMGSKAFGNHSHSPVARLEAHHLLLAHQIADREARFIDISATILPTTLSCNLKCAMPAFLYPDQRPDTEGIKAMRFRDAEASTVPSGPPPAPSSDRHLQSGERIAEGITRRIHSSRVP